MLRLKEGYFCWPSPTARAQKLMFALACGSGTSLFHRTRLRLVRRNSAFFLSSRITYRQFHLADRLPLPERSVTRFWRSGILFPPAVSDGGQEYYFCQERAGFPQRGRGCTAAGRNILGESEKQRKLARNSRSGTEMRFHRLVWVVAQKYYEAAWFWMSKGRGEAQANKGCRRSSRNRV